MSTSTTTATGTALEPTRSQDGPRSERQSEPPKSVAEAMRKLWSPKLLAFAIGCLLIMNFFMNFTSYTSNVYDPYATSHFQGHSLITTGAIINGLVRIVAYPLLAKLADHFGRPLGFSGAALFMALGHAMYASCRNVETYLAGGILESFGDTWWNITQQIFIADVTSLVNRGIIFTLPESITAIPTLYAGTYLGEHMLLNSTWRWGFGMWAIILPATVTPTVMIMLWMQRRAKRMGLHVEKVSILHGAKPGSGIVGKIVHVGARLDIIGALLLIGGLAMTLLPMTIAGRNNTDRWKEPSSIVLVIIGVLTFICFLVWDGKFASYPIIPYRTIRERNVIVACCSCIIIACSDSCYRPFLSSFLQVAGFYSPGAATRVDNSQRVAYNVGALVAGLSLKYVKQTKPFIMFGVVLICLANGLPIYLTNVNGEGLASEVAFITSKAILGIGRGFCQVPLQVSLQAVLQQEHVAVATAVFLSSLGFGHNIGVTISGAIWNSVLPRKLMGKFEADEAQDIFGSLVVARSYERGTPERDAINECYRETQQTLAIASVSIASLLLAIVWLNRNVRLDEEDQKRAEQASEELSWASKQKDQQQIGQQQQQQQPAPVGEKSVAAL